MFKLMLTGILLIIAAYLTFCLVYLLVLFLKIIKEEVAALARSSVVEKLLPTCFNKVKDSTAKTDK